MAKRSQQGMAPACGMLCRQLCREMPLNVATQMYWRRCRLPVPRPGQVLGLVGTNGIGKSTALKVLAGKLKPNLGRFEVGAPLRQGPG